MWIEAIKSRTSVRTYNNIPLDAKIKQEMINYLNEVSGPFDEVVRFSLLDLDDSLSNQKLGTYGIIKGAKNYILASTKKEPRSMEQLGYVLEKGILYATSLGLGTCWLGGTFKRQDFIKAINLQDGEILPIITPFGHATEKRSLLDSFMRMAAGSKSRKSFKELFFDENWGNALNPNLEKDYIKALEMVRLAPSASNKQPWRVLVKDNKFYFYLQRTLGYGGALGYDIQKIDMGIGMCHFELSMKELGVEGRWIVQEPDIEKNESMEYIITFLTK